MEFSNHKQTKIPIPSSSKVSGMESKLQNAPATFDFSNFRWPETANSVTESKPLKEINQNVQFQRRACSPEPRRLLTQPSKLRKSKSTTDISTVRDPCRGVKRINNSKNDVLPSKRLKSNLSRAPIPTSKASSFHAKPSSMQERKINAITNVMKSSSLMEVATVRKPATLTSIRNKDMTTTKTNMAIKKAPLTRTISKPIAASKPISSNASGSQTVSKASTAKTMKPAPYDFKARFNLLKEKYDELKANFDTHKQIVNEHEENIAQLQEINESAEEKMSHMQNAITQKEEELTEAMREMESLKEKCSNLSTKNKALTASLNQQTEELFDARKQIEELTKQASEAERLKNKNLELENQLKEQNERLDKTLAHLYSVNSERMVLHNQVLDLKGNIRVFARVRPPLGNENDKTLSSFLFNDESTLEIGCNDLTTQKKLTKHEFAFDQVFDPNTTQNEIFEIVAPLVQSALDGYNICIFAYGQTGSGKTFTMDGPTENPGIIPRTIDLLFRTMNEASVLGWKYTVNVYFLEIYNEILYDLLDNTPKDVEIRMANAKSKTEIYVSNINIVEVKSAADLYELMRVARKNRATACTVGNERSSRSHAVTKIEIIGKHPEKDEILVGNINLVDLAGSESPKTSTRMDETKNINRSLSELSNVILSLVQKNEHIPYRNSKLTHLLMPSLGGNSKTLMFVNVSPVNDNFSESVKSLRFASQVNSCKLAKVKKNKQSSLQSTSNL